MSVIITTGGASTYDGYVTRSGVAITWADVRTGVGTTQVQTGNTTVFYAMDTATTTDRWSYMTRGIFGFDTSAILPHHVINSATVSFKCFTKSEGVSGTGSEEDLVLDSVTPDSDTVIDNLDYNIADWGGSRLADDVTQASVSGGNWFTFTLNAAGKAAINKGGITFFGGRCGADIDDSEPTWSSNATSEIVVSSEADAGDEPYLTLWLSNGIIF